jgi:hypothetical protein
MSVNITMLFRKIYMSNSNTINRLLRISENEPRFKKKVACLWVLQYVGIIVFTFAMLSEDGTFFGTQISVDRVIWLIILLAGATSMFVGYYERKMIQVVRAIKDRAIWTVDK